MTFCHGGRRENMKKNIHPKQKMTKFVCACGNVIEAISTREEDTFPIEVCSECHPFYTGKQNLGSKKDKLKSSTKNLVLLLKNNVINSHFFFFCYNYLE